MHRVFNFGAGPAMLPEEVLQKAQAEMLDWHGTGMSIMELGHRGPDFQQVAKQAEADLRELMSIPENYYVLFVAGGASSQFAMVPINLFNKKKTADYVDTGIWSKKAYQEAQRYGSVNVVATTERKDGLLFIPPQTQWKLNKDAAFLHYTPNETIEGIEFNWVPHVEDIPLVADMSSMILSRPVDVTKYGIIYAGAQKNIGQAGLTVVIIRKDLVHEATPSTPTLYTYKIYADNFSCYNTPPTYSWYMAGLVFDWMKRKGGIAKFYAINKRKAEKLYHFLDNNSEFYSFQIHPDCRSMMNVAFNIRNEKLIERFLQEAKEAGLTNLKGHRTVGGIRASIYNSMPEEGVDALINFMADFKRQNR